MVCRSYLSWDDVPDDEEGTIYTLSKISQKEIFVGWYTTGSSFKSHDTQINQVFARYTESPIFLVVDVEHNVHDY